MADESDSDLATKLSNPVASLISVPLQFNEDCCYGPASGHRITLNIQPVIPFVLSSDWNLIVRTILPLVDQEEPVAGLGNSAGLGDTTQSFFFSPREKLDGWVWAAGPVFLWPTTTDGAIGGGKWGAGPTALVLKQQSGWTYGLLANHIWSYAGSGVGSNLSNTLIQPFVGYTWPDTTGVTLNTETTYDWTAGQWTVPINLTVSHLFRFGHQPVSFQLGGRYYAEHPQDTANWGMRAAVVFLFPE
ncbi:MAG TPA: hypothetical protein VFV07_08780 [Rhizomicrobium sp.]|nr:hypothetical protein [Rhizomicrobium sp.]